MNRASPSPASRPIPPLVAALWAISATAWNGTGTAWGEALSGGAPPAAAQGDAVELFGRLVQVLGFLLVLVVAAALLRRYGKRWEGRFSGGPIQLLAGRNFAPGVGVRLIRVGSRSWLVGVSRDRVTPIAELTAEDVAQALKESAP